MITASITALVLLANYAWATERLRRARAVHEPELADWAAAHVLAGKSLRAATRIGQRRLMSAAADPDAETARRFALASFAAFVIGTAVAFLVGQRVDPLLIAAVSRQQIVAVVPLVGVAIAALATCQSLAAAVGPVRRPRRAAAWAAGALGGSASAAVAFSSLQMMSAQ